MFCDAFLFIVLLAYGDAVPLEKILEVQEGQTVQISCESKDSNHTFAFWELPYKDIIGPGNEYDEHKYEYNVLNGTLYVRDISPEDEGVYTCFSRNLLDQRGLYGKSIRMIVIKDWSRHNNDENTVSPMTVTLLIGSILILLGGGYLVYRKWSREHRLQSLLIEEDEEDDSGEDVFTAPGTSKSTGQIILGRSKSIDDSLSTDFGSILSASNK